MKITLMETPSRDSLAPISNTVKIGDFPVAGVPVKEALLSRISQKNGTSGNAEIKVRDDFWPSDTLLETIIGAGTNVRVMSENSEVLLSYSRGNRSANWKGISPDAASILIRHPWDLLKINETLIAEIKEDLIEGKIRSGANIDGHIRLGKGSVLLPGTYIEGNVIIGKNCKIGPNCYIRGNTSIGDGCHIGQAVEIKNSLIMEKVSVGHLSYIGDSVICRNTNLGAGTITANLRHDGKNQKSFVGNDLVDTGRRKLGVIIGEDVHTGIHTSIYPGRKIWPGMSTRPGEIVSKDIVPS